MVCSRGTSAFPLREPVEGLSRCSSETVSDAGTHSQRLERISLRPLGHPRSECAQHPGHSSCLRHNRHAVGSQLSRTPACDDLARLRRSLTAPSCGRSAGRSHTPFHSSPPESIRPECDPGPSCVFSHPDVSSVRLLVRTAGDVGTATRIHGANGNTLSKEVYRHGRITDTDRRRRTGHDGTVHGTERGADSEPHTASGQLRAGLVLDDDGHLSRREARTGWRSGRSRTARASRRAATPETAARAW